MRPVVDDSYSKHVVRTSRTRSPQVDIGVDRKYSLLLLTLKLCPVVTLVCELDPESHLFNSRECVHIYLTNFSGHHLSPTPN